ncbi:unnamed protein product [Meganyctiphanes norvegica]|uniref:Uncharacterized protein n=1 Tax=Meganyctiphanes norvegica TaxID=48144 RepID=A0AAV2QP82_MEGNR
MVINRKPLKVFFRYGGRDNIFIESDKASGLPSNNYELNNCIGTQLLKSEPQLVNSNASEKSHCNVDDKHYIELKTDFYNFAKDNSNKMKKTKNTTEGKDYSNSQYNNLKSKPNLHRIENIPWDMNLRNMEKPIGVDSQFSDSECIYNATENVYIEELKFKNEKSIANKGKSHTFKNIHKPKEYLSNEEIKCLVPTFYDGRSLTQSQIEGLIEAMGGSTKRTKIKYDYNKEKIKNRKNKINKALQTCHSLGCDERGNIIKLFPHPKNLNRCPRVKVMHRVPRKCPIPGCDGSGNIRRSSVSHVTASNCPKKLNKTITASQNVL